MKGLIKKQSKSKEHNRAQINATLHDFPDNSFLDSPNPKGTPVRVYANCVNLKINSKLVSIPNFTKLNTSSHKRRRTDALPSKVQSGVNTPRYYRIVML